MEKKVIVITPTAKQDAPNLLKGTEVDVIFANDSPRLCTPMLLEYMETGGIFTGTSGYNSPIDL